MTRDRYARQSLGTLHNQVKESRVLMVGAGGIGCELLKNLVLVGFGEIHIVDLDTIDLSNLNRQFLFRHEHIKKSKALVAKESAQKFNPNVSIHAHHANIKDPQFNLDWFQNFNIVFNALDNLDARRHVNKMCLAADVPLIDGGTAGFEGYVQVIKKGKSECYDCNAKETPKTFPVCTIRSTPSQPIHCIVWAKSYLFAEIFGTSEDDAPELDTSEDSENAKEIEALQLEAQALKRIRESMGSEDFPRQVFEKVYKEDIERLRSMEDMWKTRQKPDALSFDSLLEEASKLSGDDLSLKEQSVWTPAENMVVFSSSIKRLANRLEEQRANADIGNTAPVLTFDKDNKDALDFVSSAANLRSTVFHIECKSEFDIKQMAGNIIPAIATTNAMVAGLCVLQSFKVLRSAYDEARISFLSKSADRVLASEPLGKPRGDCPVCGVTQSRIEVDLTRAKLSDLVDGFLREKLGYGQEFSVSSEAGLLFDADFEDNLAKELKDLSIKQDSFITVVDEADDEEPRVNLVLSVLEKELPPENGPINLTQPFEIARKVKVAEANGHSHIQENGVAVAPMTGKRKREGGEDGEMEAEIVKKRGKVVEESQQSDERQNDAEVIKPKGQGAAPVSLAEHGNDETPAGIVGAVNGESNKTSTMSVRENGESKSNGVIQSNDEAVLIDDDDRDGGGGGDGSGDGGGAAILIED